MINNSNGKMKPIGYESTPFGDYNSFVKEALNHFKKKYNPPLLAQIFCCKRHKERGDEYFKKKGYEKAV